MSDRKVYIYLESSIFKYIAKNFFSYSFLLLVMWLNYTLLGNSKIMSFFFIFSIISSGLLDHKNVYTIDEAIEKLKRMNNDN